MWPWIGVVVWLICGFLAYGMIKDFIRRGMQSNFNSNNVQERYSALGKSVVLMYFCLGPLGLFGSLLFTFVWTKVYAEDFIPGRFPFVCFKMPKHLCENRA